MCLSLCNECGNPDCEEGCNVIIVVVTITIRSTSSSRSSSTSNSTSSSSIVTLGMVPRDAVLYCVHMCFLLCCYAVHVVYMNASYR